MAGSIFTGKSVIGCALGAIVAVAAFSALPANAQDAAGRQPPPGQSRGAMSVEAAMKLMDRSYKAIARGIDDPAKDEATLKAVSNFQAGAASSKAQLPHTIEEKSGDEKAAAITEYRKLLLDLLKLAVQLEDELLAGKRAEAKATLDKIHALEEQGHKKFAHDDHQH